MPILKVSKALQPKEALSGLRIPVVSQPIDNCPQCGTGGYRDGICQNRAMCGYMDPKLIAAIQAWQEATMMQQAAINGDNEDKGKPSKKKKKTAGEQTPRTIVDNFSESSEKVKKEKCKVCNNLSIVDGSCETQGCFGTLPPLGLRTPESPFTGINEKAIKNKGPVVRPTFSVWQGRKTRSKKTIEASIKRLSAKSEHGPVDPGAFLDSSMILPNQPVVRMRNALGVDATMKAQQKSEQSTGQTDGTNNDENNSEELQ